MGIRKREKNKNEELEVITDSKSPGLPRNVVNGFRALFVEFCSESSIPGVRYFAARKRHWAERLCWTIAFIVSSLVCGFLIHDAWIKWNQSPLIMNLDEKSISTIPFPAITICPETKAYKEKFNFTAVYHTMYEKTPPYDETDEEIVNMEAISHICEPHLTDNFALGTNITDERIFKIINELAPNFVDTMFFCKWRNKFNFCQDIGFKPILTEEGVCFTFNALNSEEIYTDKMAPEMMNVNGNPNAKHWNLENGYQKDDGESYPHRAFGAGARTGLYTLLRLFEADLDYLCRGPVQGFKILLHTPDEVPQVSKNYFRVPLSHEVLVSVKPNMITTSEGLRHYEPNRRQCYFNSERQLKFFKTYTQRNCELECLANYTLKECECVKFSMPRDKNTPVCGAAKKQCYNEAEDKLMQMDYLGGLTKPEYAPKGCNCLPACTSITYDTEISQAKLDHGRLLEAFKDNYTQMLPARLSIFFKKPQFTESKRSEAYGITNLLAMCGGLLALFMGISMLSIVEILHFCTLRMCRFLCVRQQMAHITAESNTVEPFPTIPEPNPIYPELNYASIQFE